MDRDKKTLILSMREFLGHVRNPWLYTSLEICNRASGHPRPKNFEVTFRKKYLLFIQKLVTSFFEIYSKLPSYSYGRD